MPAGQDDQVQHANTAAATTTMISPTKALRGTAALNPRSTVLNHGLPRSYACYLLRSFGKRTATYIGSTPDPPRRIKQHNGLIVGGAFKTRLGRPWEKELIVYGFPSKLQALQFEWAWQNPHASRHLHAMTGTSVTAPTPTLTPAKAAARPSAQFPKSSMSNRPQSKVQVLQFMLTSKPWTSFNLEVMLFSRDAQTWWDTARNRLGPVVRTEAALKKWEKEQKAALALLGNQTTADPWGTERGKRLDQVRVILREEGVDGDRLVRQGLTQEGIGKIQVQDDLLADEQWAKFTALAAQQGERDTLSVVKSPPQSNSPSATVQIQAHAIVCVLCASPIDSSNHLTFTLCTASSTCQATCHLPCLASHMLLSSSVLPASSPATPAQALATRPLMPTRGHCPACDGEAHWQDLIRGSFRRDERARAGTPTAQKRRARKDASKTQEDADDPAGGPASMARVKRRTKVKETSTSDAESVGEVFDMDSNEEDQDDDDDPDATEAERSFARMAELESGDDLGDDGVISSDQDHDGRNTGHASVDDFERPGDVVSKLPRRRQSKIAEPRTGSRNRPASDLTKAADVASVASTQSRLGLASSKATLTSTTNKKAQPRKPLAKKVEYIELSDST